MKNMKKKVSALVITTVFAMMQVSATMDTGLGAGNGGAVINSASQGFAGMETGTNSATLNFTESTHLNWDSLNVNSNEALNFNAVGNSGITVLNTVNHGMSNIYGQINANSGISKLIISNPNGVLFDGAKFTTAGDVMITTKDMTGVNVNNINDGNWTKFVDPATNNLVSVQIIENSDFSIGGAFNIIAPRIVGESSKISAGKGLKLVTANGSDYLLQGLSLDETKGVTILKAMNIDGNVEIVNNVGALSISDGTKIKGNLKSEVGGYAIVYGEDENNKVKITGDVDLTGHGQQLILRTAKVNGNVTMNNDGGAVEINNVSIGKNANLTTTGWQPINHKKYNHYVHVSGNTDVGGDLNISSSQNIHIGNYEVTNVPNSAVPKWEGNLLPGKLTVKGDLKAEVTQGGHIMTTIDTTAKNVDFTAKTYKEGDKTYGGNILSDDKATITANTYKFKSDGYIGGVKEYTDQNGKTYSTAEQVISLMENYTYIPKDIKSHAYTNIAGGTITNIETPKDSQVYIASNGNVVLTGANAGDINLTAFRKRIDIQGPNVHAKNINIGPETDYLKVEFEGRDFTTNYTNIKDGKVVTIRPDEKITYELADGNYNQPTLKPTANKTYLIGPDKEVPPEPEPTPGPDPDPDPDPTPTPDPDPDPNPNPPTDDNVRVKLWVPEDPNKPMASTPVAYAADLDEDEAAPCRKNVDGSVTVVRAYPMD